MNPNPYDSPTAANADDAIAAASRLEAQGKWTASIDLYRHAAQHWPEHREYVQHCIDRITEKQALAQTAQADACPACEYAQKEEEAKSAGHDGEAPRRRGIRGSVRGALILLFLDIGLYGSFLVSFLVCLVWFLVAVLKNAVERPGWRLALLRIAIPPLVLWLVQANDAFQRDIAKANAAKVIAACDRFRADNGELPQSLDELVPRYLQSVPPAKYCLAGGGFRYWNFDGSAKLVWCVVPPYSRAIYNFDEGRWKYLD